MQRATTPPFRFRTPPGWPTPSSEWVELYQGAEPAAGWTPAPGIPPAPAGWRFWSVDRRSFRTYLPSTARLLRLLRWIGLGVAVLGYAALCVLAAFDGPAIVALPFVIAGLAVLVVASSRVADLTTRTAASIRDDAAAWCRAELPTRAQAAHPDLDDAAALAAWDAASWSVPEARPFDAVAVAVQSRVPSSVRRSSRVAVGITAGLATAVLLLAASTAAVPVVHAVEARADRALAQGTQHDDGTDAGGDGTDPGDEPTSGGQPVEPDWTSVDGGTTATFIGDDETGQATCGAADVAHGCWSWTILSTCDGPAAVMVSFSETEHGRTTRTDERTVDLSAGTPLALVEQGSEQWANVDGITCDQPTQTPLGVTKRQLDSDAEDADGSWPDGCVDFGCAGWELTATSDCSSATVQFAVDEEAGSLADPHDLVVTTPLRAGQPVDVWAAGAWSSDDDAQLVSVTCG